LKQASEQSNKASEELRSCEDQWLVETNQPATSNQQPATKQPNNQTTKQTKQAKIV
jgi:hypothetical protein